MRAWLLVEGKKFLYGASGAFASYLFFAVLNWGGQHMPAILQYTCSAVVGYMNVKKFG